MPVLICDPYSVTGISYFFLQHDWIFFHIGPPKNVSHLVESTMLTGWSVGV